MSVVSESLPLALPPGWEVCDEVQAAAVLAAPVARHCNRFVNPATGRWEMDHVDVSRCWEIVELHVAIGEAFPGRDSGVAQWIAQDAWRFARSGGFAIRSIAKDYFSRWKPHEEFKSRDVCQYCGVDNGATGELRQGWDCWNCGGN